MKKPLLIMFGGISPEHEVSVITGLQVLENIDREKYEPHAVLVSKSGEFLWLGGLRSRKEFAAAKRKPLSFGRDAKGGWAKVDGLGGAVIRPYSVYLAFHGGLGEGGGVQGMLESLGIPHTSTSQESSVICMNKQLTKEAVAAADIKSLRSFNWPADAIRKSSEEVAKVTEAEIGLPAIVKPVHLGSSIGIKVAHTTIELEKFMLEASFIDSEILVEKFLSGFTEYNCAVRMIGGQLETSEIERPLSKDEILSFTDKYQRGSKKTGGAGMASLQRELPAKIDKELKERIQFNAKVAYGACRCKGMIRIDFMLSDAGVLYLTEINPIPGSMAFYLWEASGIPFKQQIIELIEQSVLDAGAASARRLEYESDIVEKFVAQ